MPKQGKKSHSAYPEHVEQVRQTKDAEGDLVFASGDDWGGADASDHIYMAAESDSWFDAVLLR